MSYLYKCFFLGIGCSFLFPPFFLFPMGFILFPILYFYLIDKQFVKISKFYQFLYGVSFGLGLSVVLLYWIKEPLMLNVFTEKYSNLALLLTLYIAVYFGFGFLILSFFKNNIAKLIMLPVVFVLLEIIREKFIFGFPWVSFSLVGSSNYFLLQLVYYFGTNGFSFFVILIFLFPVSIYLFFNKNSFSFMILNFFIVSILIAFLLVILRLNSINEDSDLHLNLSINQLNISQSDKIKNNTKLDERIDELLQLIKKNKNTIHIFSETDYPFIINNHNIVNFFQKNLSNNNSIVIGGIRKDGKNFFNTLYYISENNFNFFDKKILVPFGEFLPFRKQLKFLENIVGESDFQKGKNNRIIKTDYNFDFVPVICYEIIFFNNLLNKLNILSPLLINITNDAWFGSFSGPYQHFYLSRIRTVEFNKSLIRVSNNGISALINNNGEIIQHIPLNKKISKNFNFQINYKVTNLIYIHRLIYLFLIFLTLGAILIEQRKRNI